MRNLLVGVFVGLIGLGIVYGAQPLPIRGTVGIHDPSTIVKCKGRYYVFGTGRGIVSRSSADLVYWEAGPPVFDDPPAWTIEAVPGFSGYFWAPDIVYVNGKYHLYYSVSTWGSQVSAIGLATNPTLDPSDPDYHWTDQGPVIQSTNGSPYNCIDPSILLDSNGTMWMAFGSYWNGIYLVELDPATGLRLASNSPVYHIARHDYSLNSIEGACLFKRGTYYYLFVNWDSCCNGMDSTYNIRVGRSTSIAGPYWDRSGLNMQLGGGSLFLKTTGKYVGPGHMGIFEQDGTNWFSFHYYDANANGRPTLGIGQLSWTEDGWPVFTNDWSALYRFDADARDDNGRYYGLLRNGPQIKLDELRGTVLDLSGSAQYVQLPNGAANAQTFVAVFKWRGGEDWQRVFDFGRGTNTYAFLTPRAVNGKLRFALATNGPGTELVLDAPNAAPINAWTHVAVVTDGLRGLLYLNGVAVATNTSMRVTVADIAPSNNVWLGRSQFAADPYFNGQLSSVRLFGRALSPAEIIAPQPVIVLPRAGSRYRPGDTVIFSGYGLDFADVQLSVTGLTWTVEFHYSNTTNVVLGPYQGVDSGSFSIPIDGAEATNGFYRVVLVATDQFGRKATNSADIYPGAGTADWIAFYPFDGNAYDMYGQFNGTLVGGATTPTDPIRGPVLNLSGAAQYVSLPTGLGQMCTFAAWVKWNGGSAWQRIFDFGVDTTRYAFLTPRAWNGRLRFAITANGPNDEWVLEHTSALPVGVWTHVAVVVDGQQAVLYLNGRAVAVNNAFYLLPSDVVGSANYLGRSQFAADPYFSGQMDSVLVASIPLPIEQVAASPLSISRVGESALLNWPAFESGLVLFTSTNISSGTVWTQLTNAPITTNGIRFLTIPMSDPCRFYRLTFP